MKQNSRPDKRIETRQKCPYCDSMFLMTHNRWVELYSNNYVNIVCSKCKKKFSAILEIIVKDDKKYRDIIGIKPEDVNKYIHIKPESIEDILNRPIKEFEFSRRTINVLEDNNILLIRDLNGMDFFDLYTLPYTGPAFMDNVLKVCKLHNIIITCRVGKLDKVPDKYKEYIKPVKYGE